MRASNGLSPREKQVLALVWDGLSVKEMAKVLDLSENRIKNIMDLTSNKLGVSGKVLMCRRGVELGYLEVQHAQQ